MTRPYQVYKMAMVLRNSVRYASIFKKCCNKTWIKNNLVATKSFSTSSRLLVAGVDDNLFGLNEDQQNFRQVVYDFCQKELAPYAAQIDKDNGWDKLR